MKWRVLFTGLGTLLVILAVVLGPSSASAQEGLLVEWTQTTLSDPVRRLYTPSSGALFARTNTGLMRSDDAGETWRDVPIPATPVRAPDGKVPEGIVVDPTNHATIYLAAGDGIYKTDDDAASWHLLLPKDSKFSSFKSLTVSPANPSSLYLLETTDTLESVRFMRSHDGGQTWSEPDPALDPPGRIVGMGCHLIVSLLRPHPTDQHRLYRAVSCSDRGTRVTLKESTDGGASWRELHRPREADPRWLVGAQQDAPDRLILGSNRDSRFGNYVLERSDDGGTSWTTMLEYTDGGLSMRGPSLAIAGLAMDPTRSDRLLLALNAYGRNEPGPPPLRLTIDNGQTWTEYSPDSLGKINDVAFGIDGRMMFVATEGGIWRGRVDRSQESGERTGPGLARS